LSATSEFIDGLITDFTQSEQNSAQQIPTLFVAETLE
jgi:hypothetical protein